MPVPPHTGATDPDLVTRTTSGSGPEVAGGPPLPPGTALGRYRVVGHIAEGGMGSVYLAELHDGGPRVALKVIRAGGADDEDAVQRFVEEAHALSRVQHEHIIQVSFFFRDERHGPAYVMELLEGETLAERLERDGALAAADVCRLGAEMARALVAVHAEGIVHRDLKPANVYLARLGERADFVKLLDFGIAKQHGTDDQRAMGTPAYMAPEQLQGELVDERADVYSLGVVLYEMLTGQRPFAGRSAGELLLKHATESPPPLARTDDAIPPPLADIVMRCLAKNRADRPSAAEEVVAALLSRR